MLLFLLCSFFPVSCSVAEKPKKATENKPKTLQKLPKECFKVNISGVVVLCLMCAVDCAINPVLKSKERCDPPCPVLQGSVKILHVGRKNIVNTIIWNLMLVPLPIGWDIMGIGFTWIRGKSHPRQNIVFLVWMNWNTVFWFRLMLSNTYGTWYWSHAFSEIYNLGASWYKARVWSFYFFTQTLNSVGKIDLTNYWVMIFSNCFFFPLDKHDFPKNHSPP